MKKLFNHLRNSRKTQYILLSLALVISLSFWIYARLNPVMPQSAIYFMNDVKQPTEGQKVLVFSPHPDDESIACGGYIIDSIKDKADVKIILVTDGNRHGLKDKRYEEFKAATKTLGVTESNLVFLNHPDGRLNKVDEKILEQEFQQQIDEDNPQIVLFPDSQDEHIDHKTTGKVVNKILEKDKHKNVISYQYLVHEKRYPQPKKYKPDLYLLPPANLIDFDHEWQRLMLDKQSEDQKYRAVECYKSQAGQKINPVLRGVMFGLIRKNELFAITKPQE